MPVQDVCDCGRKIEQPTTGRRRSKCLVCSPPDRRDRRVPRMPGAGSVVALPTAAGAAPAEGMLAAATRAELDRAERTGTARGMAALAAAGAIDHGGHTASGLAALLKAHRDALNAALEGAKSEADAIDAIGSGWDAKASG